MCQNVYGIENYPVNIKKIFALKNGLSFNEQLNTISRVMVLKHKLYEASPNNYKAQVSQRIV